MSLPDWEWPPVRGAEPVPKVPEQPIHMDGIGSEDHIQTDRQDDETRTENMIKWLGDWIHRYQKLQQCLYIRKSVSKIETINRVNEANWNSLTVSLPWFAIAGCLWVAVPVIATKMIEGRRRVGGVSKRRNKIISTSTMSWFTKHRSSSFFSCRS